ncbi:hypothetical protein M9Y10_000160 [Tritrichomonas musculus]|uniref:BACK domain-containing protein n=1 Tax=Tritrichomonas musculus TaxID=1915356 RepID=A0ABR2L405_9EUKA
MSDNSIILSSSGLKNIFKTKNQEEEFEFIFGEHKLVLQRIFAEFLSPLVSRMHLSDPTINYIDYTDRLKDLNISKEVLSQVELLSEGERICITKEQIFQMQIISLLLGNDELFSLIEEQYEDEIDENNIDKYLSNLNFFYTFSPIHKYVKCKSIVDYISTHFYSIDENKLLSLHSDILYSIISNEKLVIESEDSLFEFIEKLSKAKAKVKEALDVVRFYEEIEFTKLSEAKFNDFIETFDINEMSHEMWEKLRQCFYSCMKDSTEKVNKTRYLTASTSCKKQEGKKIDYDGNESHRFKGIINYLTEKSGSNVSDNGTVNVTSSSIICGHQARNSVDLENSQNYFQSAGKLNSWLRYDFIENKVRPTRYSIRTRHNCDGFHPRNWVIEGSNTGGESESEWTVLDSHQNDETLKGTSFSHTFDINKSEGSEEFYRYLRIRQTGNDSNGENYLTLSALEFFGFLIEK